MGEKSCPYVICFISEFLGTIVMMYIGCMGCFNEYNLGPTIPSFTFGFAILAAIQIFAGFSPVHVNPSVTTGLLILGHIEWQKSLVYYAAQYAGAMAGYYLLVATLPDHPALCLLKLAPGITPWKGFTLEVIIALILLLVVAGSTDGRNHQFFDSIGLRLGIFVAGLVFSLAPYTGACLNPARSLPPCVYYNNFNNHWLYHLAPYTGTISGALVYKLLFDNHWEYSICSIFRRRADKEGL